MSSPRELRENNRLAVKRAEEFRRDVQRGDEEPLGFHTLKREFPFHGFIPCSVRQKEFLLFAANDDVVGWEMFWTGEYEREVTDAWITIVKGSALVLDVGAYTGVMSILACLFNPEAQVIAFEPMPRTVERLNINLRVNGFVDQVSVVPAAVSDTNGKVNINMPRPVGFLGTGNSIDPKPGVNVVDTEEVRRVSLDDRAGELLPSDGPIGAIKLDVEGHELQALLGMRSLLKEHRPPMIVEVWRHERDELFQFLAELGYESTQLQGMNHLFLPT